MSLILEPHLRTPPLDPIANWTCNYFEDGPQPADGASVPEWGDTVGGYTGTQGTANRQFEYIQNAGNGYPGLNLDASTNPKYYELPASFHSTFDKNNFTFFFVSRKVSTPIGDSVAFAQLLSGTVTNRIGLFWFNGSIYLDHGNALVGQRLIVSYPLVIGQWYAFGFRVTSTSSLNIWANGVNLASNNSGVNVSISDWIIGNSAAGGTIESSMRRALAYNRSLSDREMEVVFNFLRTDIYA